MPVTDYDIIIPGQGDGQPGTISVAGTGHAVPAGLDAVLEYNGLFMNIQQNVDRYKITSMDGLYDADVRDTRDANTADDGETPYNSFYGGRTITISGTIETYTIAKLRDMQQALRAAFADIRNEYQLHFRTGDYTKDHVIYCKKMAPISGIEQQQSMRVSRDFQVTLRASNPRYLSFYSKFLDIAIDVPVTQSETMLLASPQNIGNYLAQPIYRIWGPTVSGCTIINDETDQMFTINGQIPFDDYLDFNIAAKTLKNSLGINKWNMLGDDSDYMTFKGVSANFDGINHLFYYGDSPRVQITWFDSWI